MHRSVKGYYTRVIASLSQPTPEYYLERAKALEAVGETHIGEALRGIDEGIDKLGPLVTLQLYAIDLEVNRQHFNAALERLDVIAPWLRPERHLQRRGEVLLRAGRVEEARISLSEALALLESHSQSQRGTPSSRALEAHLRSIIHELPLDQSPLAPKN
jgi:tetratricopeptide (TPR) repeat protein